MESVFSESAIIQNIEIQNPVKYQVLLWEIGLVFIHWDLCYMYGHKYTTTQHLWSSIYMCGEHLTHIMGFCLPQTPKTLNCSIMLLACGQSPLMDIDSKFNYLESTIIFTNTSFLHRQLLNWIVAHWIYMSHVVIINCWVL